MTGRICEIRVINVGKGQVVADRYVSTLVNSISILSYFQVEVGCRDYLSSIFNALVLS